MSRLNSNQSINAKVSNMLSIEDETSLELYRTRSASATNNHRQLKHHHHHHKHHHKHHHGKEHHKHLSIHDGTQHGMMIDAGSQGTRIHIYEFEARILSKKRETEDAVAGKKLSIPTTDTRWTNRLNPGLDTFAFIEDDDMMVEMVSQYLSPLIEFAKRVLVGKKQHWKNYPIYLKATGGLRALPRPYRIRLITAVRTILQNTTFNPFFFEQENARVISGEEEAIYGWAAVNFVKGSLIENSVGSGAVLQANLTYGVVEMGGASLQIGFFEPFADIMSNLFKLQIGAAKHWNVYVHSFLYFGVNSAYDRLNARLIAAASSPSAENNDTAVYNPCLPGGSEYLYTSRLHVLPNNELMPLSSRSNASVIEADMYSSILRNPNLRGDYDSCNEWTKRLLRKDANAWCEFAHDRDCSTAGVYQPPLPIHNDDFGEFIATSNFYEVWSFLKLPSRSSLLLLKEKVRHICSFSLDELVAHNKKLDNPIEDENALKAMCFRSAFAASFLIDGVGFPETYHVTALDVVNGQKLGWALGSMLYEINALPWEIEKKYLHQLFALEMMGNGAIVGRKLVFIELFAVVSVGCVLMLAFVGHRNFLKLFRKSKKTKHVEVLNSSIFAHPQIEYGTRSSSH